MKNWLNAIARFLFGLGRPSKAANSRLLRQRGESLESLVIREATPDDIPALAELHVKTWNETYWNVRSPPSYGLRERQWREQFQVTDGSWFCFVVENQKGELVGFAKGNAYSHSDLPDYSGELNKIYLLREYQRLGLGRRLVQHVAQRFLSQGINTMVLFGTPQNPSCAFHEALGGERLLAKERRVPRWLRLARFAQARHQLPRRRSPKHRLAVPATDPSQARSELPTIGIENHGI